MISQMIEDSDNTPGGTACAATSSPDALLGRLFVFSARCFNSLSESLFIEWVTARINQMLVVVAGDDAFINFTGPTPSEVTWTLATICLTLLFYHILFGNRHWRRRRRLAKELDVAKEQLSFLEERLQREPLLRSKNKDGSGDPLEREEIRIFMEGAFDMMHFGHMNAFRLGRSLGTHLVVGVNSDESITKCKAAPLMNNEERLAMVQSCKFVDEVIPNTPYIMSKEYIDWVIETHNVDYIVHGDDPCIVDGKDVYETAKRAGKFRTIPRTEGVSTTDIVGRMLLLTKEHHMKVGGGVLGSHSKFLTTTRLLQLFSTNVKSPASDMRVVYIDGAWDMFHPGHVAILKAAKERGDFLLVGINSDSVVNKIRGMNLPLLNLHERVLSVLGCRFVDDVLIDAPYEISPEMIASLNIAEVVHGICFEDQEYCSGEDERYRHAKDAGIFTTVKSPSNFRLENIFKRIRKNQDAFEARFEKKMKAENLHYTQKYGEHVSNGTSASAT
mmetsp:Transcript_24301/g.45243  ORF Transcript_24301/g.45243 Transcript_24301/m.45243 type:complete len:501 (+) Transcript_24301:272-1774(+)